MSNKKEQWGNIELPGMSDEELLSKNWNHVAGIKTRNSDPAYKKAITKRTNSKEWQEANHASVLKTVQTDQWKDNHSKGMERMKNDPEWQKEQRERFEKRSHNQDWKDRKTEASRRLAKDPNWLANTTRANQLNSCKPIITPIGIFSSLKEAGEAYIPIKGSNARKHVMKWLKDNPTEFYYISREEYILLTGKEL